MRLDQTTNKEFIELLHRILYLLDSTSQEIENFLNEHISIETTHHVCLPYMRGIEHGRSICPHCDKG